MIREFSKFDKFKRALGDRWHSVSVYNIEGLEALLLDSFKLYFYSLMNKQRDISAYIDRLFKKAKKSYLIFKIVESTKETEEKPNGTLKRYLESEF